jgi:YD repeat-containing protein
MQNGSSLFNGSQQSDRLAMAQAQAAMNRYNASEQANLDSLLQVNLPSSGDSGGFDDASVPVSGGNVPSDLTGTTDATGMTTVSRYDSAGRKVAETDGNGNTQTWRYDTNGHLVSHTDLSNKTYRFDYDLAGHLVHQTSDWGQDVRYTYDTAGRLVRVDDAATGTTATYAYDLAGNRVAETTVKGSRVLQDNHLAYDADNRLRLAGDGRYDVRYDYDNAGNRVHETSTYFDEAGVRQERDVWNAFDQMNRQTIVAGLAIQDAAGQLLRVVRNTASQDSHALEYDTEGNRIGDTFHGSVFVQDDPHADPVTRHLVPDQDVTETYVYDAMNRLTATWRDGVQYDYRRYDAAGRLVMSGLHQSDLLTQWFDSLQQLGLATDSRFYLYDDAGRLQTETVRGLQGDAATSNLQYRYDHAGNLAGYTLSGGGQGEKRYVYTYRQDDSYQVERIDASGNGGTGQTVNRYDANGYLVQVEQSRDGQTDPAQTRVLDNDVAGHALRMVQDGQVTHTLIVNGQELGSSGTGQDDDGFGSFRKIDSGDGSSPGAYTVQAGDVRGDAVSTLRAIARTVWGDETAWYRIAEANGMSGGERLAAGQVITIPARGTVQVNSADSMRRYDAHALLGDTTPSLPNPAADDGGCGRFGQVLAAAVAIAVALVVTAATQNPQAGLSSWQAFTTALANAGAGAAAAGAAAGDLAGQVVGNAAGVRDGFSWQEVALSAVSGGISGGLSSTTFSGNVVINAALKAGIANALTQGVAVVTGLQEHFDWRGVVANAVGAGTGAATTAALGDTLGKGFAGSLARGTVSGLAAGLTTAALRGGTIGVGQVARDAFGNAIGSSIVENSSSLFNGSQQGNQLAIAQAQAAMSQYNANEQSDLDRLLQMNLPSFEDSGGLDNASMPVSGGNVPSDLTKVHLPGHAQFFVQPDGIEGAAGRISPFDVGGLSASNIGTPSNAPATFAPNGVDIPVPTPGYDIPTPQLVVTAKSFASELADMPIMSQDELIASLDIPGLSTAETVSETAREMNRFAAAQAAMAALSASRMSQSSGGSNVQATAIRSSPLMPNSLMFSAGGSDLLKGIERLRLMPYDDQTGKSTKKWVKGATIGYGYLIPQNKWDKFKNGISKSDAEKLFKDKLKPFVSSVQDNVRVPLTQNQFDALVILNYNIGTPTFEKSSVLKMINDPSAKTKYATLEQAWKAFNKSQGKVMEGLNSRRNAEWNIYNNGVYQGW